MPQPMLKPMEDVRSVGGKERSPVQRVQSAEDVALLLPRIIKRPKLITLAYNALQDDDGAVWIWGKRSFAIAHVMDTDLYGRMASLDWLEGELGFRVKKDLAPIMEEWARTRGAKLIATYVMEERAWERLTGWKPFALVLAKEL